MPREPERVRRRFFTAGLGTESNTFIGRPVRLEDFAGAFLCRPGEFPAALTEISAPLYVLRERAQAGEIELVEGTYAFAFPAGRVEDRTYELLRDEILGQLTAALPVDAVVLSLHGAMCSESIDDCEGDLLGRVRRLVGPDVPIGIEFDLHAHLSDAMVAAADVLIAFKEYPHTDFLERARELVSLLDRCAATGWRPAKRVFDCRTIARFHTNREPMRGIVDWICALEREPGIVSISLVHGFPFGDVRDVGTKVLALAEDDARAAAVAALVGEAAISIRDQATQPTVELRAAVEHGAKANHAPVVIADVDDNPGSGAPGDDWSLASLLIDSGVESCMGPVCDPDLVRRASRAGPGARVEVVLRGVALEGERSIEALVVKVVEDASQTWAGTRSPLGRTCALRIGNLTAVITSVRDQAYGPDLFGSVGVDPLRARIIAVKSAQHFAAGFAPCAAEIVYARGGGLLHSDFRRLRYRNLRGPLWPLDPGVPRRSLRDWLDHWATERPTSLAIVDGSVRLSWAELAAMVARWSAALIHAGVAPGDRIAMLAAPGVEFLSSFLATSAIGGIWVGLNPRYTPHELDRLVQTVTPRLVFADVSIAGAEVADWMRRTSPAITVIALGDRSVPGCDSLESFLSCAERIDEASVAARCVSVDPREPCLLVFTSGSTGTPKGALISQWALTGASEVQVREWGCDPLRVLDNLPINHIGCVGDLAAFTIVGGGTLVCMARFDPPAMLDVIQREGITVLGQVPSMFTMLLDHPGFDAAKLASLRLIFWGGAHASSALVKRLRRLAPSLATSYGQTETVGSVTFTPLDATETELAQTVGRPVPPYLVRVRPLEGEFGAIGEVEILSPFRFNSYWGDAAATAKAVGRNGWLLTGDLGTLDRSGALRLTGRVHRVFKSGGYNVSPTEIEAALLELPEVLDACVVGVEDPLWGHVPVAFVVASRDGRDADTLLGRLRDSLANYKIPKRLVFMDSMPRLAIGKVNVKALLSKLSADP